MRIKLSIKKRYAITLTMVLLWLTIAVELISPFFNGAQSPNTSKIAYIISCTVVGANILFDFYLMLFEASDYWIDEKGITRYGFFGHIKLNTIPWSYFCFIGALPIKNRWNISNVPQMKVICSKKMPRKRFSNSSAYVVNELYGTIQFDYSEELLAIILQYSTGECTRNE